MNMIVAGLPGCQGIKPTAQFSTSEEEEAWNQEHRLGAYLLQVNKYKGWSKEDLQKNIAYFLDEVAEYAHSLGINLCAHPDDPPFTPFMGTPRAVGSEEDYKFLMKHGCGVNLCTGSLTANPENRGDITGIIQRLAKFGTEELGWDINRVFPHVHLRPIETDGKNFVEGEHARHVEELRSYVATLSYLGWHGVYRPDHSTTPTYEIDGNGSKPIGDRGYHGAGRAEGLNVLLGLFAGMEKTFDRDAIQEEYYDVGYALTEDEIDKVRDARLAKYTKPVPHMRDRAVPSDWLSHIKDFVTGLGTAVAV
jgi:D-mannonate dehydratase